MRLIGVRALAFPHRALFLQAGLQAVVCVCEDSQLHIGGLHSDKFGREGLQSDAFLLVLGVVAHWEKRVASGIRAAQHRGRPPDVHLGDTPRRQFQVLWEAFGSQEHLHQGAAWGANSAHDLQGVRILHHFFNERLLTPHGIGGHVLQERSSEHSVLRAIELVVEEVHGVVAVLAPAVLDVVHVRPRVGWVPEARQIMPGMVKLLLFLTVFLLIWTHLLSLHPPRTATDDIADNTHALARSEKSSATLASTGQHIQQELPQMRSQRCPMLVLRMVRGDV
mmetsp:Transcript_107772/g.344023  ORF Transcript_107772/g.344023 Transcript_107772/m.344023 type:complete len:279 (-) Transcript_107772:1313-2149(-)